MNLDQRETPESVETASVACKIINSKNRLDRPTRGSPSLVNGARLRTSSLRGSWVRIPPPALHSARRPKHGPSQYDHDDPLRIKK